MFGGPPLTGARSLLSGFGEDEDSDFDLASPPKALPGGGGSVPRSSAPSMDDDLDAILNGDVNLERSNSDKKKKKKKKSSSSSSSRSSKSGSGSKGSSGDRRRGKSSHSEKKRSEQQPEASTGEASTDFDASVDFDAPSLSHSHDPSDSGGNLSPLSSKGQGGLKRTESSGTGNVGFGEKKNLTCRTN